MKQITEHELRDLLVETFEIHDELSLGSDLSVYIKDSIDLGEMLAVLKDRFGIILEPSQFTSAYTLGEVLAVVNGTGNEKS
jgi:acyl carrier protein